MINDDKSILTLLVQNAYRVYCYFNISAMTIKEFEDMHGENSWKNSKPVIKVYEVICGEAKEIKTIYIDNLANNWFINLERDGMDIFVKLGRMLPNDNFAAFAVSNTVTTPRNTQSNDRAVYYVDVSQHFVAEEHDLPTSADSKEDLNIHKEPKPYPFVEEKKN